MTTSPTTAIRAALEAGPTPATLDIPATVAAGRKLIEAMPEVKKFALIGSALYLPGANDVNFAVLIDPALNAVDFTVQMHGTGWGNCGEYDGVGGNWAAIRRENLNFMVTHDPVFYQGYVTAMEVCKALGLRGKHERIAVCQIVRDGKTAAEAWSFWTPNQIAALHESPAVKGVV